MSMMIPRGCHIKSALRSLLDRHPVVAILARRQVGKTTLAQQVVDRHDGPSTYFELEDPDDLAVLDELEAGASTSRRTRGD